MKKRRGSEMIDSDGLTFNNSHRRGSLFSQVLRSSMSKLNVSRESVNEYEYCIHLLDDEATSITSSKRATGRSLLGDICEKLGIHTTRRYFGLRFEDDAGDYHWLDMEIRVAKQLPDPEACTLCFRLMYYPANPEIEFPDEVSRWQLYLQLRRDLYVGRLKMPSDSLYQLAAYALQAEHGFTALPTGLKVCRLPESMRLLSSVTTKVEECVRKQLLGILALTKDEAMMKFLVQASDIETYAMEPFQVEDQFGGGLCIGFNHRGLYIYKESEKMNEFPWACIGNIYRSNKNLVVHVDNDGVERRLGFKCKSVNHVLRIWHRAIGCKCFYTLSDVDEPLVFKSTSAIFGKARVFLHSGSYTAQSTNLTDSQESLEKDPTSNRRMLKHVRGHSEDLPSSIVRSPSVETETVAISVGKNTAGDDEAGPSESDSSHVVHERQCSDSNMQLPPLAPRHTLVVPTGLDRASSSENFSTISSFSGASGRRNPGSWLKGKHAANKCLLNASSIKLTIDKDQ